MLRLQAELATAISEHWWHRGQWDDKSAEARRIHDDLQAAAQEAQSLVGSGHVADCSGAGSVSCTLCGLKSAAVYVECCSSSRRCRGEARVVPGASLIAIVGGR